jgi:hypothetical protein
MKTRAWQLERTDAVTLSGTGTAFLNISIFTDPLRGAARLHA